MEISNMLTLSTGHIRQSTSNYLNDPHTIIPTYPTTYGWFICIADIPTENDVPTDLMNCINFAKKHGTTWIQFDNDAEPLSELPTYEWSDDACIIKRRIKKNDYYLNIANAVSKRSTCLRRHYGAVIVNNDEIVATGYNGSTRNAPNCCDVHSTCPRSHKEHNSGDYGDCPAVHAEQNALLSAARNELNGATLYLSGEEYDDAGRLVRITDIEPCPICYRMIQNAGIKKIVTPNKTIVAWI